MNHNTVRQGQLTEFFDHWRCENCVRNGSKCWIEEPLNECLLCSHTRETCIFTRTVSRTAPRGNFTWAELIGRDLPVGHHHTDRPQKTEHHSAENMSPNHGHKFNLKSQYTPERLPAIRPNGITLRPREPVSIQPSTDTTQINGHRRLLSAISNANHAEPVQAEQRPAIGIDDLIESPRKKPKVHGSESEEAENNVLAKVANASPRRFRGPCWKCRMLQREV